MQESVGIFLNKKAAGAIPAAFCLMFVAQTLNKSDFYADGVGDSAQVSEIALRLTGKDSRDCCLAYPGLFADRFLLHPLVASGFSQAPGNALRIVFHDSMR